MPCGLVCQSPCYRQQSPRAPQCCSKVRFRIPRICLDTHGDSRTENLAAFTALLNTFTCSRQLPPALLELWGACSTIALLKEAHALSSGKPPDARPISMGFTGRRVGGRACIAKFKDELTTLFRGIGDSHCLQLGTLTPSGNEQVLHELTLHHQANPGHLILHLDVTNAFNSQSRYAFIRAVKELIPELLPAATAFYLDDSTLYVYDMDNPTNAPASLRSTSGQQQGDTLGSVLFCIGIQPILNRVHAAFPTVLIRAITDDIHLAGPPDDTAEAFTMLKDELAAINLHLKYSPVKTCAWSPSFEPASDSAADIAAAEARRAACPLLTSNPGFPLNRGGMRTLGSAIGTDRFVSSTLAEYITDLSDPKSVASACAALAALAQSDARGAKDVAGNILRSCVVHKASYLTRTTSPPLIKAAAARADSCIRSASPRSAPFSTSTSKSSPPTPLRRSTS